MWMISFKKIQANIFGILLCSIVRRRRSLWAWCFGIRCQNNNTNWIPNSDYNVITSSAVSFGPYSSTRLLNFPSITSGKWGDNIPTFPQCQTLLHCAHTWSRELLFFPSLTTNCYQLILLRVAWFMLPWIIKYSIANMCKVFPKRHLCLLD